MASIRLSKQDKTIKIVYRKDNVKLSKKNSNVSLHHSGKVGPKGDKGDKGDQGDIGATGVSTFVRSHHQADPNVARPNALYVEWVGSVAPNNATTEDTWVKTA